MIIADFVADPLFCTAKIRLFSCADKELLRKLPAISHVFYALLEDLPP